MVARSSQLAVPLVPCSGGLGPTAAPKVCSYQSLSMLREVKEPL